MSELLRHRHTVENTGYGSRYLLRLLGYPIAAHAAPSSDARGHGESSTQLVRFGVGCPDANRLDAHAPKRASARRNCQPPCGRNRRSMCRTMQRRVVPFRGAWTMRRDRSTRPGRAAGLAR